MIALRESLFWLFWSLRTPILAIDKSPHNPSVLIFAFVLPVGQRLVAIVVSRVVSHS